MRQPRKQILCRFARHSHVEGVGAQVNSILPFQTPTSWTDAKLFKNLRVIPRRKHTLPRQIRQLDFAFHAIRKFDVKAIWNKGACFSNLDHHF